MEVTIQNAATILRISPSTLRGRINEGSINAHQRPTREGLTWFVELPEDNRAPQDVRLRELVDTLKRRVEIQGEQLTAKDRQIGQLRFLLHRTTLAGARRSKWRFWD